MHCTQFLSLIGATAGLAAASPAPASSDNSISTAMVPRTASSCSFDTTHSWSDKTLFQGLASADIELGIRLPQATFSGSVDVSVGADFLLSPILHFDLSGLAFYVELDLYASAAVSESIELLASEALSIDLSVC
jgi:hypothetical protein